MSLITIKSLYGKTFKTCTLFQFTAIFDVLGTTPDPKLKEKHYYKLMKKLQELMKFNLNQLCTYEPHLSPFENLKFGTYREIEEELSNSSWKFTHDLTLAISTISDSSKLCKNKVISTYSLQSAIGILLLGSNGETREQIQDNVFHPLLMRAPTNETFTFTTL